MENKYCWYNTKIYNCYKLKRKEQNKIIENIMKFRLRKNLPVTRSFNSYKRELKAHKRLYILGLFRNHTKDCDLEEHIKTWKRIIYFIIGF